MIAILQFSNIFLVLVMFANFKRALMKRKACNMFWMMSITFDCYFSLLFLPFQVPSNDVVSWWWETPSRIGGWYVKPWSDSSRSGQLSWGGHQFLKDSLIMKDIRFTVKTEGSFRLNELHVYDWFLNDSLKCMNCRFYQILSSAWNDRICEACYYRLL